METGLFAFAACLGLAASVAVWSLAHRRSIGQQLEQRGFVPCDADAGLVARGWITATGAGAPEELQIANCLRRPAGRGYLYHFTVRERSRRSGSSGDSDGAAASYPAYLLDLRDASWVGKPAVTLHVLPPGSRLLRKLVVRVASRLDERPLLPVGAHPWREAIVAAHGDVRGSLDEAMPAPMQERLAKAGAHGFFTIHVGGGKAAFASNAAHRDVDAQMTYLNSWV